MTSINDDPKKHLLEKILAEVKQGKTYDALQYVQSFIARKKKAFGARMTSSLLFYGCLVLLESGYGSEAGVLLLWYVKRGGGDDCPFFIDSDRVASEVCESTNDPCISRTCDLGSTIRLLQSTSSAKIAPLVEQIYLPIQKLLKSAFESAKDKSILFEKYSAFERVSGEAFESSHNWTSAAKCFMKLHDISSTVRVVHSWACEGYSKEYPLFFARVVLQFLVDGQLNLALQMIHLSQQCYPILIDTSDTLELSCCYKAVWHLSIILTELSLLPQCALSDKQKVFESLYPHYSAILAKIDKKLNSMVVKIAEIVFQLKAREAPGFNPMSLLQGLLGGGSQGAPGGDAMQQLMRNIMK